MPPVKIEIPADAALGIGCCSAIVMPAAILGLVCTVVPAAWSWLAGLVG